MPGRRSPANSPGSPRRMAQSTSHRCGALGLLPDTGFTSLLALTQLPGASIAKSGMLHTDLVVAQSGIAPWEVSAASQEHPQPSTCQAQVWLLSQADSQTGSVLTIWGVGDSFGVRNVQIWAAARVWPFTNNHTAEPCYALPSELSPPGRESWMSIWNYVTFEVGRCFSNDWIGQEMRHSREGQYRHSQHCHPSCTFTSVWQRLWHNQDAQTAFRHR